jgi:NAD(P)H-hydrate epimerase
VTVLAGTGNNGGDGYVAARYLTQRGAAVTVEALGLPRDASSAAGLAAAAAKAAGVRIIPLGEPTPCDLLVDALFGAGFRGELASDVALWTDLDTPTLSVDVPSGLHAGSGLVEGAAFTADRTVTFQALKTGHLLGEGPDRSGRITVVDIGLIGIRPELLLCEGEDAPVPRRGRDAHKWSAGSVVVVGGSPGITGAAMLTATAALHGGAGAATIACPGGLQRLYAGMSAGVMSLGIGSDDRFSGDDVGSLLEASARYDVMVLGPGLGPVPPYFVAEILRRWDGGLVLDADGLNALEGLGPLQSRRAPTIVTPHAGEFRRLTGVEAGYEAAARLPDDVGVVLLLKGNPTFVLGAERWVVTSGGPELATIGTGDVLAGLAAAYWAGGLDIEVAARSAAYWHGVAGSRLATSETVTAGALAVAVGGVG